MDNANEYDMNYAMVYYTKCKYITIKFSSEIQATL